MTKKLSISVEASAVRNSSPNSNGGNRRLKDAVNKKTSTSLLRSSVVWQGLTSAFATDMDILGEWLERWYLGVQENE